jgi:hypothetical protein
MISKLVRKAGTLRETLHDFYREPLASFQALVKGLEIAVSRFRRNWCPGFSVPTKRLRRDQRSAGAEYQANGEWIALIEEKLEALRDRGSMGEVLESFFRKRRCLLAVFRLRHPALSQAPFGAW